MIYFLFWLYVFQFVLSVYLMSLIAKLDAKNNRLEIQLFMEKNKYQ